MPTIGQKERAIQNRVIKLFRDQLGYTYLGDWKEEERSNPIEKELLTECLSGRGVSDTLINRVHSYGYRIGAEE